MGAEGEFHCEKVGVVGDVRVRFSGKPEGSCINVSMGIVGCSNQGIYPQCELNGVGGVAYSVSLSVSVFCFFILLVSASSPLLCSKRLLRSSYPPASTSLMLRLQVCITPPAFCDTGELNSGLCAHMGSTSTNMHVS